MTQNLYIGLMSGTSLDGVDAVIIDISRDKNRLLCSHYQPYPEEIRLSLRRICEPSASIQQASEMDTILGKFYAKSVQALLQKSKLNKGAIRAIGSHGQTIRHQPESPSPYTLQIGDPNLIAELTGIPVVADFRRRDIAAGGQGAPLVPAFHQAVFGSALENRAIINIGGIANITYLPHRSAEKITGFDCGPGNTLMDFWVETHQQSSFDDDGKWARSGSINRPLLEQLLQEPFFNQSTPKSTGTDYFSPKWLQQKLDSLAFHIKTEDVQATLTELTAQTICSALQGLSSIKSLYICGGGTRNSYLMERIAFLSGKKVETTEALSISPDWVEAMAFAWLAQQTINQLPGNIPSVTGASHAVILGGIYNP